MTLLLNQHPKLGTWPLSFAGFDTLSSEIRFNKTGWGVGREREREREGKGRGGEGFSTESIILALVRLLQRYHFASRYII